MLIFSVSLSWFLLFYIKTKYMSLMLRSVFLMWKNKEEKTKQQKTFSKNFFFFPVTLVLFYYMCFCIYFWLSMCVELRAAEGTKSTTSVQWKSVSSPLVKMAATVLPIRYTHHHIIPTPYIFFYFHINLVVVFFFERLWDGERLVCLLLRHTHSETFKWWYLR